MGVKLRLLSDGRPVTDFTYMSGDTPAAARLPGRLDLPQAEAEVARLRRVSAREELIDASKAPPKRKP